MDRRRASRLNVEPRSGILAVGHQTSLLDPHPDVASVVRAYVDLVMAQRSEIPATRDDLRDLEVGELAEALQLPVADVEGLVADDLDRRFGHSTKAKRSSGRRFFRRG
jgi:hypothetical protein